MWGAAERARFKERQGAPEIALQVIDLVKEHGNLDDSTRDALSGRFLTTLRRLFNDPRTRNRLGIDRDAAGHLLLAFPAETALPALQRVVTDFATGQKDVKDVYHRPDRKAYLDSLQELPEPSTRLRDPVLAAPAVAAARAAAASCSACFLLLPAPSANT